MTDDEIWKRRSNINKIREMTMADGNATKIEKMAVVTLTEIHDQLWWIAFAVKISVLMSLMSLILYLLFLTFFTI